LKILTPTIPLLDLSCCSGSVIVSLPASPGIVPRMTASHMRNRARGMAVPNTIAFLHDLVRISCASGSHQLGNMISLTENSWYVCPYLMSNIACCSMYFVFSKQGIYQKILSISFWFRNSKLLYLCRNWKCCLHPFASITQNCTCAGIAHIFMFSTLPYFWQVSLQICTKDRNYILIRKILSLAPRRLIYSKWIW
jgi:hypothetical protein